MKLNNQAIIIVNTVAKLITVTAGLAACYISAHLGQAAGVWCFRALFGI
jgi:hypothetical protein